MLKKIISTMLIAFSVIISAAAAETIFPAVRTDSDGVTRYGYLDEEGKTVLPFAYAKAGEFAACGLAEIEDEKWQTGVIDRTGKLVIPYTESPQSVDFSEDMVAYRYPDHSVYYTTTGEKVGSYAGAVGFFENGVLMRKSPASGLYSFIKADGSPAFEGEFRDAGEFLGGRALVRTTEDTYIVIDTAGNVVDTLESGITPAYMSIYGKDTIVVTDGKNFALYALDSNRYITEYIYNEISPFHGETAMVRVMKRWGLIDLSGKERTHPVYYYLSYMGDGLYAARSEGGAVSAVDADGNIIYRTTSYVGGFDKLKYGIAWHGMENGNLIFFKKNGGYFASLKNAENPTMLSENVVRVTQDGVLKYINLTTGNPLFAQPTSYDLGNGVTANTIHYERFFGYQEDGSEYGWDVDFPEISGLPNEAAQKKINDAIRDFFLKGPSVTAEYEALEGGYGVSVEGSVLVVWANCISGKGSGSSVWNNNLAFDMRTGEQYSIHDLMTDGYTEEAKKLLPQEHEVYLYSFPRMSREGVTFYYNEYESETRRAYTEDYLLSFAQLEKYVNKEGACYKALEDSFDRVESVTGFTDVKDSHWALDYIVQIKQKGIMQGDAVGTFRPDANISGAEVCATIVRSEKLEKPEQPIEGIAPDVWYAGEVSAMHEAGLLEGLEMAYAKPMTRADAMQIFANLLVKRGAKLPDEQKNDEILSAFADAEDIPAERRAAAALCVEQKLIEGADGKLSPQGYFTRAQFAKLLILMQK